MLRFIIKAMLFEAISMTVILYTEQASKKSPYSNKENLLLLTFGIFSSKMGVSILLGSTIE